MGLCVGTQYIRTEWESLGGQMGTPHLPQGAKSYKEMKFNFGPPERLKIENTVTGTNQSGAH